MYAWSCTVHFGAIFAVQLCSLNSSQEQSQELDFSINTASRLQGNDGPIIEPAASQLVKSLPRTVSAYISG